MSEQCYEPEDFERLLDLPEDHEDRHHLDSCAVCRSEMALYRSFMSRDRIPADADLADANARLGEFLEREISGAGPRVVPGEGASTRQRWDLRRWSPVLVAACLVCVAIFVNYGDEGGVGSPSGVVRDLSSDVPVLTSTETATTDGFVLSWNGPDATDHYQVVIVDVAMAEVDRFAGEASGRYELDRQDHPWLGEVGPFLWYVVAMRDGDEIARSTVRVLESGL